MKNLISKWRKSLKAMFNRKSDVLNRHKKVTVFFFPTPGLSPCLI